MFRGQFPAVSDQSTGYGWGPPASSFPDSAGRAAAYSTRGPGSRRVTYADYTASDHPRQGERPGPHRMVTNRTDRALLHAVWDQTATATGPGEGGWAETRMAEAPAYDAARTARPG